jgi:hypothetical protein
MCQVFFLIHKHTRVCKEGSLRERFFGPSRFLYGGQLVLVVYDVVTLLLIFLNISIHYV